MKVKRKPDPWNEIRKRIRAAQRLQERKEKFEKMSEEEKDHARAAGYKDS